MHDPAHSTCYLDDGDHTGFYEGGPIVVRAINTGGSSSFASNNLWQYSQYVPHDTAKLIELQGGTEAFIRRLDFIFDNVCHYPMHIGCMLTTSYVVQDYFDSTNEPSQQIPFMYHYANRPGLSTERSRQTISKSYNTTVFGLPGNDGERSKGLNK